MTNNLIWSANNIFLYREKRLVSPRGIDIYASTNEHGWFTAPYHDDPYERAIAKIIERDAPWYWMCAYLNELEYSPAILE